MRLIITSIVNEWNPRIGATPMPNDVPNHGQLIIPYLAYADAAAALEFLEKAFGFVERFRYPMPDGTIGHAEIGYQDNIVMLATAFEPMGFASPRDLTGCAAQMMCYVDDVDSHFERARSAGATIAAPPSEDHGQRSYRAVDPEGHRWIFATRTADASQ
jgi:PhnB protein